MEIPLITLLVVHVTGTRYAMDLWGVVHCLEATGPREVCKLEAVGHTALLGAREARGIGGKSY